MEPTVNSIIRIQNEESANILATLNKFKAVQDIPYKDIKYEKIDEFTVELIVKYPLAIFDRSVAQFLAILFGELPYQRGFGTLRFMRLELPEEVLTWFQGPKFGVEGIKHQFGLEQFPFLMSIIKPSLDLAMDQTTLEQKLQGPLAAGFHAVKDDEMQGNLPNLPLSERFSLAMKYKGYIKEIMAPYEKNHLPYGLAFGALIFNSEQNPKEMAKQVIPIIARYQAEIQCH